MRTQTLCICKVLNIVGNTQKHGNILLEFRPQPNIDVSKLMQMISAAKGKYLFTAGANPYLTIKPGRGEGDKPLLLIKNFFEALKA